MEENNNNNNNNINNEGRELNFKRCESHKDRIENPEQWRRFNALLDVVEKASHLCQKQCELCDKLSLSLSTPMRRPNYNYNNSNNGPLPPPDMPQAMRDFVDREQRKAPGGGTYALIIQKRVRDSDIKSSQGRLSLPLKGIQFYMDEFLRKNQKEAVMALLHEALNPIEVRFVFPNCLEERVMTFKKWDYIKSMSYVLINNWYRIAYNDLNLQNDQIVQIWFFKDFSGNPCLALVNLGQPKNDTNAASSSGTNAATT